MDRNLIQRFQLRLAGWQNKRRIAAITRQVAQRARPDPSQNPVVFFNASTRLTGLSLNAAFQLITSWGLRLAGVPVIQFTCQAGMSHCVLGLDRHDFRNPPPCEACIVQTQRLYNQAQQYPFRYHPEQALADALQNLSVAEMSEFEYPFGKKTNIPLGRMVLSSVRWTLRMHHLADDESMRYLLRQYTQSAYSVARQFDALIHQYKPSTAVIFNGMLFPEAAARWVKENMKKPVVGFIAGITAPPGKRMGHAGAIISGGQGTAQEKLAVMEECGIKVTRNPAEMGKTLKEARGSVQEAIDTCHFFQSEGRRLYGQTVPSEMPNKELTPYRRPLGVVAIVTAGNFPIAVPSWKIVPALLTGNTIVWKPSEDAPAVAYAFARLIEEAGVPAGVADGLGGTRGATASARAAHGGARGTRSRRPWQGQRGRGCWRRGAVGGWGGSGHGG